MPANLNKRSVPSSLGDKAKTFVQWGLLSMEALRLKCNQYSLAADGKKVNLQRRLVTISFYNTFTLCFLLVTAVANGQIMCNCNFNDNKLVF